MEIGHSPCRPVATAIPRRRVKERENGIAQLLAERQMAALNTMRPRTSIIQANRTLGRKSREPLEYRLGADSEIPSHRCGHLAVHDLGNHKRAAVRTSLSIGVQLHDLLLSTEHGITIVGMRQDRTRN